MFVIEVVRKMVDRLNSDGLSAELVRVNEQNFHSVKRALSNGPPEAYAEAFNVVFFNSQRGGESDERVTQAVRSILAAMVAH
jgi:hypothetical protein